MEKRYEYVLQDEFSGTCLAEKSVKHVPHEGFSGTRQVEKR
ncbi:hypothetical protein [Bacillus sp. 1P02SD]